MQQILSWKTHRQSCSPGEAINPDWQEICNTLEEVKIYNGVASLRIYMDGEEHLLLQVRADNKVYIVTLGELVDDDYIVRSTHSNSAGRVTILGDLWDASMTTQDFNIVVECFKSIHNNNRDCNSLLV